VQKGFSIMKNRQKIGWACAFGALAMLAVFFVFYLLAARLLILGLLSSTGAGFLTGYVCYDVPPVIQAFWLVWRDTPVRIRTFMADGRRFLSDVAKWFRQPHPVGYPVLGVFLICQFLLVCTSTGMTAVNWVYEKMIPDAPNLSAAQLAAIITIDVVTWATLSAALIGAFLYFSLWVGLRFDGKFAPEITDEAECYRLHEEGLKPMYLTYSNTLGYASLGMCRLVLVVFGDIPAGIVKFLLWICGGVWFVVRYIHCHERVLCGTCSVFGGIVALLGMARLEPIPTTSDVALTLIAGALIGATSGVLYSWFVSLLASLTSSRATG
jgi:hypothetical protein